MGGDEESDDSAALLSVFVVKSTVALRFFTELLFAVTVCCCCCCFDTRWRYSLLSLSLIDVDESSDDDSDEDSEDMDEDAGLVASDDRWLVGGLLCSLFSPTTLFDADNRTLGFKSKPNSMSNSLGGGLLMLWFIGSRDDLVVSSSSSFSRFLHVGCFT